VKVISWGNDDFGKKEKKDQKEKKTFADIISLDEQCSRLMYVHAHFSTLTVRLHFYNKYK
jgi:hypothetical protein